MVTSKPSRADNDGLTRRECSRMWWGRRDVDVVERKGVTWMW